MPWLQQSSKCRYEYPFIQRDPSGSASGVVAQPPGLDRHCGLGLCGSLLSMTYSEVGYLFLGFDIDQAKADAINQGQNYIEHIDGERLVQPRQQ